jgi:hypothetical protein
MSRISLIYIFILILTGSLLFAAEYDKVYNEMTSIANTSPTYAQMMDIGKNDQSATIYGLRLENPNYVVDGQKPNNLLVGAHHGNERLSADVSLTFAKKLIAIFKNTADPNYAKLSKAIFYVIPVLNIGGYNSNSRYEKNSSGSSIDVNRDYPDVCVHNQYYRLASVRNLVDFVERYNILGAVTVHGYIGTFTYPWGIYTDNTKTLDDSFYNTLGTQSVKANGYRTGTHTDVIYAASGSFEDWAYYKHGIWTTLLELASSPNLDKDAQCMLIFFSMLPDARSKKNQHTGNCTSTRGEGDSRP